MLLISIQCSTALQIHPSFQHYNDTTEFISLLCTDDNDGDEPSDDVEWLSPNFTLLMSSSDYRVFGI